MRVVLDTNVLISALGFQGETRKIWDLAEDRRFELFASAFILSELERNLLKLGVGVDRTALILEDVLALSSMVRPSIKISAIHRDPSDNHILECAVEAEADILVTGDLRDVRPLGHFRGIEILTPREFLDKYF